MTDTLEIGRDDRAVSGVIGFVLIFAILIISLSTYQAVWVPIQNEQVEFDHYQTVSDDMTDARSAIFEARTNGETQSTTVKLGTRYPNRLIAVNPAPATGTLEAGERRNISMTNQADGTPIDIAARYPGVSNADQIYTQFLSYSPNYNELDTGAPIRHEHGLLYKDFNETAQGGGLVIQNDGQTLVQTNEDGPNELTLVPIQGNYSEQGAERVSLDPEPGILVSREFTDVNVTVPTDLRGSTWKDVLSEEMAPENVVVDDAAGELTLVLDGTWRVQYAPVGVDGVPPSGERGSSGSEINPASPGDVRLTQTDRQQDQDQWVMTFENTAGTVNISEARVNFYPGDASAVEYVYPPDGRTVNWDVGDDFAVLDPSIQLTGESTTDVTVGFDKVGGGDEWWIFTVIFETGEQGMYFISEGGTAVDGGGGTGQTLQAVETDGVTGGTQLTYTIENTGTNQVTITDFAVDASAIDTNMRLDNGDSDELKIIGATEDGAANTKSSFKADGTQYNLVDDSNNGGSNAVLSASDDSVDVDFRGFSTDMGPLEFADSEAEADVTVSLYLSDGSEQVFYFRQA